jgi:alanine racemase
MGTPPSRIAEMIAAVKAFSNLRYAGLIAHLYDGPNVNADDVQWQLDRMSHALDVAASVTPLPRYRIAPSTGALMKHGQVQFDRRINAADPGRLLVGIVPSKPVAGLNLKPAFVRFESKVVQVRELDQEAPPFSVHGGAAVRRIGIVAIGRADGMSAVHTGHVLVCGERAPIVGEWIEHTTIDLDRVPSAQAGDEVVVIGTQGGQQITVDDVLAAHPGLRPVDIALSISKSVARVGMTEI